MAPRRTGATGERRPIGRFMAWIGLGPEPEPEGPAAEADEVEERPSEADEVDERPSEAIDVEESGPPEPIDVEERIRLAAASAAEAAERRAMDEITALEEEIEQIREEAAARVGELESRLEGAPA